MKLENQVPSLELCKKLKSLGYKQKDSLYYWIAEWGYDSCNDYTTSAGYGLRHVWNNDYKKQQIAAPTVAEMGEVLPGLFDKGEITHTLGIEKMNEIDPKEPWYMCYTRYNNGLVLKAIEVFAETEANCRAKMWLYLKKNNLLAKTEGVDNE